jgi:hypothetical protein
MLLQVELQADSQQMRFRERFHANKVTLRKTLQFAGFYLFSYINEAIFESLCTNYEGVPSENPANCRVLVILNIICTLYKFKLLSVHTKGLIGKMSVEVIQKKSIKCLQVEL